MAIPVLDDPNRSLSPPLQVIVAAARHYLGEDCRPSGPEEWLPSALGQSLVDAAADHSMGPLLLSYFKSVHVDVPRQTIAALQQQNLRAAANSMLIVRALHELFAVDCGALTWVTLKGVVVAEQLYGDLALRPAHDLDLLVREAEFEAAVQRLQDQGYQLSRRFDEALQWSFRHPETALAVDLHWGLPPRQVHLNSDLFIARRVEYALRGQNVSTLSPVDTFLVACVNATKEGWLPSVHQFVDVVLAARRVNPVQWPDVVQRARHSGCLTMVCAAVSTAAALFGPVCQDLTAVVPASSRADKIRREIVLHFDHSGEQEDNEPRGLVFFPSYPHYTVTLIDSRLRRWTRRWTLWLRPSKKDEEWVVLPRRLAFLYYVLRPARWLWQRWSR